MNDPLIQVVGTIVVVQPPTIDKQSTQYVQKIILDNVMAVNNVINLPDQLLVITKSTGVIPFKVNDPITVMGFFSRQLSGGLSYMYGVHAPQGYLRYSGRIFR